MFTQHISHMDQDLQLVLNFFQCAEEDPSICSSLCCQGILNHLVQAASKLLLKNFASLWFDWKVTQSRLIPVCIPYGCLSVNYVDLSRTESFTSVKEVKMYISKKDCTVQLKSPHQYWSVYWVQIFFLSNLSCNSEAPSHLCMIFSARCFNRVLIEKTW